MATGINEETKKMLSNEKLTDYGLYLSIQQLSSALMYFNVYVLGELEDFKKWLADGKDKDQKKSS